MIPVEQLKTIPLFAALEDQDLAHLAGLFHRTRYRLGDVIGKQGEEGDAFVVIESGTLRARQVDAGGRERVVSYMPPPYFFGETSLLTGVHRDATVDVFSEEAVLLVLLKNEFDALLNESPGIQDRLTIRPEIQQRLETRVYPWLAAGEVILVNTRRHWFALVLMLRTPAIVAALLLALAFGMYYFDTRTQGAVESLHVGSAVALILFFLWVIGVGAWSVVDWSNDSYVVTNKRVAHIEKVVFLFEEREQAPIEQVTNVQEIAYTLPARVFGFSDLRVETAGQQIVIDFTFAPRSAQIRRHISEQMDRIRSGTAFESRERDRAFIRDELREWLLASGQPGVPTQPEAPVPAATVPAAPIVMRKRKRSSLGRRLNDWLGLRIEEGGQVTWRKHWFVLIERVMEPAAAFGMLLLAGILQILGVIPLTVIDSTSSFYFQFVVGLATLWIVGLFAAGVWVWYKYEDWRNDIYRVTDTRVLDIERSPFGLRERLVETTLERVQNVSYLKPSLLANIFNYGDLVIETAGGQGRLIFYSVVDPREATEEIFRRCNVSREGRQQEEARQQRTDFLDWFREYDRFLRERGDAHSRILNPPPTSDTPPPSDSSPPSDATPGSAGD